MTEHKIELRCMKCSKLLGYFKAKNIGRLNQRIGLEIKCGRCKTINFK